MRFLGIAVLVLIAAVGAGFVALRFSDGPVGPLPGGALRAGPLVEDRVIDWTQIIQGDRIQVVELQLVVPVTSRLAGVFVHAGELYVACDLGYIGRRAPGFVMGWIQFTVLSLKHWHLDAERDGRVVLRIRGNRYERQAVRVTNPALLEAFRARAVAGATDFFGSLKPVDTDPNDIWFFRLDPRPL